VSELRLLGFEARVSATSGELYVYDISGKTVLEVRSLLNRRGIPNVVRRVEGRLCVVTTSECKDLENLLMRKKSIESADNHTLAQLATSAIRLRLRQEGWTTSYDKVFDSNKYEALLGSDVRRYKAYKVAAQYYKDAGCFFISIDPCYKIETFATLSMLSDDVLNQIQTVKICGEHYSFELLELKEGSEEAAEYAKKTVEMLRDKLRLPIGSAEERVAKVHPRSSWLKELLAEYNLLVKETKDGRTWSCAYLPIDVLCPLPSLENLQVLGLDLSKYPMWMTPNKRYKEAKKFSINIKNIQTNGLEVELLGTEPISVKTEERHEPQAQTWGWQTVGLGDVVDPGVWGSKIAPIRKGLPARVALVNEHPGIGEEVVSELKSYLKERLKEITKGSASVDVIQSIDEAHRANYNALVYIGKGDSRSYAEIEYKAASRGLIPQYIDGDKLNRRLREEGRGGVRVGYYAFPIAKGIAFRAGWRYLSLRPPYGLEGAVVAGVDRTYVRVGNGVGLGVVPVLMSPDGLEISYLDPIVGGGEEDLVVSAVHALRKQLDGHKADTLVLLINRVVIPRELEEALRSNFDRFICVCATKDHSYSRLLRRESNDYVNPLVGSFCVIEEDDKTGTYLVSASDLRRKSQDRTVKPLLVRCKIEGPNVRPREVVKYVLDMNTLNIEGVYFPASLPWPLYRADRLCKKLSKLTLYTRNIPPGRMLELL